MERNLYIVSGGKLAFQEIISLKYFQGLIYVKMIVGFPPLLQSNVIDSNRFIRCITPYKLNHHGGRGSYYSDSSSE